MARIHVEDDLAGALWSVYSGRSDVMVVEASRQPEDFAPQFGWDFMAPKNTRQIHVNVGDNWALITTRKMSEALVVDLPAYSSITDSFTQDLVEIIKTCAAAAETQAFRISSGSETDPLLKEICRRLQSEA